MPQDFKPTPDTLGVDREYAVMNVTANSQVLRIDVSNDLGVVLQVANTGIASFIFEESVDGAVWAPSLGMSASDTSYISTLTTTGTAGMILLFDILGANYFRITTTAFTSATNLTVTTTDASPVPFHRTSGVSTATIGALNAALTVNVMDFDTTTFWVSANTALVGTVSWEGSMDGTNWIALNVVDIASNSFVTNTNVFTFLGRMYRANTTGLNFARARCSAYTSGSAVFAAQRYEDAPSEDSNFTQVQGLASSGSAVNGAPLRIAGSDGTITRDIRTDASGMLLTNGAVPQAFSDVGAGAITSTLVTGAFTSNFGNAYQINIPVTAVSGTNPTMDVIVQESDDGANWFDVWHFERITATGMYRSPVIPWSGRQIRYSQTIGGTTPSFTRTVNRLAVASSTEGVKRRFFDRTLNVNALSSSATFDVSGCDTFEGLLNLSTLGAPAPAFRVVFTPDGTNWYAGAVAVTPVAAGLSRFFAPTMGAKFARLEISTAGTGAVAGTAWTALLNAWKA